MATINKRRLVSGNIVWELTHGTGRHRQRFSVGQTKQEAEAALEQFNRQLALHGEAPADGSVESVLGLYAQYITGNRRHTTCRRYLRVLKTFHECFLKSYCPEVVRLRQITPSHLEEYKLRRLNGKILESEDDETHSRHEQLRAETGQASLSRQANAKFGWLGRKRFKSTVTPRTVNYELRVIGTFFQWAVRRNQLFVNPAVNLERIRIPKRALPKFLTSDELRRLFEACRERERRLFMTVLLTGMRKGEVMHLLWSDINLEMGVIFIQEKPQWGWKPKTDERIIPISPALREVLLTHHASRRDDHLVFPNRAGERDPHLLDKLKRIGRKAGVPHVTVHALRHSFGAHLRMAGVNLADIADLMGHRDIATTQIYAKVQQDHLRSAIARLTPLAVDAPPQTPKQLPESTDVVETEVLDE